MPHHSTDSEQRHHDSQLILRIWRPNCGTLKTTLLEHLREAEVKLLDSFPA